VAARLTDQDRRLRAITEAEFQQTVTDLATRLGWTWYHSPKNRPVKGHVQNVKAGYPDLHLVRASRSIFAELKRETGKATAEQHRWLARLADAGHEVYLWKPSDLNHVRTVLA
jgi:hypothetical protein